MRSTPHLKQSQVPALHLEGLLVQVQHLRSELGDVKPGTPVGHLSHLAAQQWPQDAPAQPAWQHSIECCHSRIVTDWIHLRADPEGMSPAANDADAM